MDFLTLAKARYSVRKLSDHPIEKEKIEKILKAAQLAPTAMNFQPHRILVIDAPQELEKMRNSTRYHYNAPLVMVVCYDTNVSWKRDFDEKDEGIVDASVVATHMLLEVANLGLGSTWVGHFDPELISKNFNLPDTILPVALLPIGYPAPEAKPAHPHDSRIELNEFVFYNQFPANYNSAKTDSTKK